MATPRIGQAAVQNGLVKYFAGTNYGYQTLNSYNELNKRGKLRVGAQELDRLAQALTSSKPAKTLSGIHKQFKELTDKIPGIKQAENLTNRAFAASQSLPSARVSQGASVVSNGLAQLANVDPRLLLIGSVAAGGAFRLPKSAGKGDPLATARVTNTPKPVARAFPGKKLFNTGNTQLTGPTSTGLNPAQDRAAITARVARQTLDKALQDRLTPAQRQALELALKDYNIPREAFGPALKQFGAHPLDTFNQRVGADNLQPVPMNTGLGGRPSAASSSPFLRSLKEGVRKQTGQQRVRDFLGQGRQPNAPRQSTAPLPVTPERSQRATQALARQEQQRAAQVDPRTLRGQTKPAESSDFNRRDRIQAGHQSIKVQQTQQQPVRRDSNGNVIRDKQPQAQRNAPSPKPTTPPGRQYTGHQSLRNQQPADGYKVNQPKSTAGGGRTFDATGELRGINPGKPVAGTRSQQATNQARATIKAILKGLYEQTPSAEVNRRIKQLERLLKK